MVATVRELAQGEFKANAHKYMDGTFPWENMKKLAEIEKCDAEPPSILSHLPKGVSTSSYATDPTTKRDMCVLVF